MSISGPSKLILPTTHENALASKPIEEKSLNPQAFLNSTEVLILLRQLTVFQIPFKYKV